ncbi:MAG TPA: AmmeMemoRadiSam system protein A [Geobacteraceae bacterium]|nr:AmmeMemoRadiSam system protein A [Geobacteraceae bacterium]
MNRNLSDAEKQKLLVVARESIVNHIKGNPVPKYDIAEENLKAKSGCFVTIKIDNKLRGCLGQFTSDRPLYHLVREMAIAAATRDPRFYPLTSEDLENIDLEISVLSPLKKIDSIEEIEVGKHGLYIEKNFYRGVLLPQVAVEYGWDRNTFLEQTCLKAGLEKNAWKEEAEIYIFSAEVFGES